ncbi:hypothetical protein BV898_18583 [Hypsibius exemplaris]|uniref:Uncharacterized protein n=1 Tax=Hypsibius exemplaris TaxID=2072580 RepID=A0A9X6RNA5_HYPEX|nr:hypothetical protein BV898_18583 [Hypsibius exemplaris]
MERKQRDFHQRLESMARNDCAPQGNRNYLSDKFAKELRRARDASTKNTQNRCGTLTLPCAQVLKSNIPYEGPSKPTPMSHQPRGDCPPTSPKAKYKKHGEPQCGGGGHRAGRSLVQSRVSDHRSSCDEDAVDHVTESPSRPRRRPMLSENLPPYDSKRTNSLEELEEKVEFLNTHAQQLLKQVKREQNDRERLTELYDEALDEVRRLRERDRPPGQDLEARVRRLECERDEAFAKVRTAQVDNEELKMKLERIGEENQRDRQRWADKVNALEHRLHTTDADRDELSRRHNHSLEVLSKMELQQEEQKARLTSLEDQKQDHLKQIENLGCFVKDLELTTKQLHEKVDEKRHEVHQLTERMTEVEDIIVKVDQHMQREKDRFIQMQNDAYQAQVRNQEVRTELRKAMRKKSSSRNCD